MVTPFDKVDQPKAGTRTRNDQIHQKQARMMLAGQILPQLDDFVKKQQSTVAPNSPSAATSIKRHLTDDNKEYSYGGSLNLPHSSTKKNGYWT